MSCRSRLSASSVRVRMSLLGERTAEVVEGIFDVRLSAARRPPLPSRPDRHRSARLRSSSGRSYCAIAAPRRSVPCTTCAPSQGGRIHALDHHRSRSRSSGCSSARSSSLPLREQVLDQKPLYSGCVIPARACVVGGSSRRFIGRPYDAVGAGASSPQRNHMLASDVGAMNFLVATTPLWLITVATSCSAWGSHPALTSPAHQSALGQPSELNFIRLGDPSRTFQQCRPRGYRVFISVAAPPVGRAAWRARSRPRASNWRSRWVRSSRRSPCRLYFLCAG